MTDTLYACAAEHAAAERHIAIVTHKVKQNRLPLESIPPLPLRSVTYSSSGSSSKDQHDQSGLRQALVLELRSACRSCPGGT